MRGERRRRRSCGASGAGGDRRAARPTRYKRPGAGRPAAGALAALAPLLATDDARLAAATVGVLASDPALKGVYPGATACVDACALLVERSLNEEDFETAHVAAKAADACASLSCEEVPDVERLLDLTKRCVDLTQPKVARAVAAPTPALLGGASPITAWRSGFECLGRAAPVSTSASRELCRKRQRRRTPGSCFVDNCFRVLCELLKSETYTSSGFRTGGLLAEILAWRAATAPAPWF